MRKFLAKAVVAALVLLPAHVWANDDTIFPPDPTSCHFTATTKYAVLTWDGQNNVHCLPIPTCTSLQIMVWDSTGTVLNCYPTGDSGTLSGAPTSAKIPAGLGITYVGPATVGSTAALPAGVTPDPVNLSSQTDPMVVYAVELYNAWFTGGPPPLPPTP